VPRVVSLLPSATEIVCAVGAEDALVGISHECDFPESIRKLPTLTRARVGGLKRSGDIDREVRTLVENALALYDVDIERLEALRPDVVVTQDLCDVCAVSLDDVRSAVARLAKKDVEIVALHPTELGHVWNDVRTVGRALGLEESAERVVAALEHRIEGVAQRARTASSRPRVLSVEWIDPVMVGGLWMPELIELGGGEALVTKRGEHAPTLSSAELEGLSPDVVLVKPCGFPLSHTLEELRTIEAALPLDEWRRKGEVRVTLADGNAFFNRSGPRLVESLEILAGAIHPSLFPELVRKHRGAAIPIEHARR